MRGIKKILINFILAFAITQTSYAATAFKINKIRFEGLQRVSQATAMNYLPIQAGATVDVSKTHEIIQALYQTGFFSNVSLVRQQNELIIKVKERPVIGSIKVTGNKEIDKDKLNSVLKEVGLVEGRAFNSSVLARFKRSLENEYYNRGRYNARVDATITSQERNRVAVKVNISEGKVAQIKQITIIGNQVFSSKELQKQMDLSTSWLFSFLTRDDQYSKQKLDTSLEAIRSYYLDRGYIKMKIDSSEVSLSPDRKDVYLTIHVTEGQLYSIKGYRLLGKFILPEAKLRNLVQTLPGKAFSHKEITQTNKAIAKALGDVGYAFANVNTVPEIDDKTRQVFLTYYIEPGQRVYVRRVSFSGHTKTADVVLRREARQMEGALSSVSKVRETIRRLNMLGYLQNVDVKTLPVAGAPDQVDLEYKFTEAPSASATAGIGYGTDGLVLNAGVNQANFLGTGKSVGVAFDKSSFTNSYSINYNDPYYTIDGIQRGFSLYYQRYTPGRVNITDYTYETYGAALSYSIPVSPKNDAIQFGFGYQNTRLNVGNSPSKELLDFILANNNNQFIKTISFNQLLLNTGWSRNGFDRAIFPTRGLNQLASIQLAVPAGGRRLQYYKAGYTARWLRPLTSNYILSFLGNVGYGNGFGSTKSLPFFQNYYAGGIGIGGQVRGFASNSLGPRATYTDPRFENTALGGNLQVTGSVGLIFPNPISPDKLRTSVFVDAGNVYNTQADPRMANQHAGPVRCSAGVSAEWRIPIMMGVLNFSLAKPLNKRPGDETEFFQFTFGTSF